MKKIALIAFAASCLALQAQHIALPTDRGTMSQMSLRDALEQRQTTRELSEAELPPHILGDLLWSAYGFNRPDQHKRTAPSARNMQEMDLYLFTHEAIYLYNAEKQTLELVVKGDHRTDISTQKHFTVAPVSIVIVANYDRMDMSQEARDFYGPCDAGYISQNIYLYCAASQLGTVACGAINRDTLAKLLKIKNGKVMLAHPVGQMAR